MQRSSGKREVRFDASRLLSELANMQDDGLRAFRRKWDCLYQRYTDRELLDFRDELRLLWDSVAPFELTQEKLRNQPVDVTVDLCSGVTAGQRALFEYWDEGPSHSGDSLEKTICEMWLGQEKSVLYVDWTPGHRRVRPDKRSLSASLTFACVHYAEHMGMCRNPDCPSRYFIASRKNQRYCSPDCASPAKKEAKLKWWRENRGTGAGHGTKRIARKSGRT
jgi:hypothetical protein